MITAAKLIGEIAGIDRFTTDAQLARIAGCAPIPVSSGRTDRHRLDRGGNRQLNHAIHMLAISRICHDPQTALYIAKQRQHGKTKREPFRRADRPQKPPINAVAPARIAHGSPGQKSRPPSALCFATHAGDRGAVG